MRARALFIVQSPAGKRPLILENEPCPLAQNEVPQNLGGYDENCGFERCVTLPPRADPAKRIGFFTSMSSAGIEIPSPLFQATVLLARRALMKQATTTRILL
jgi:hypothetical protein